MSRFPRTSKLAYISQLGIGRTEENHISLESQSFISLAGSHQQYLSQPTCHTSLLCRPLLTFCRLTEDNPHLRAQQYLAHHPSNSLPRSKPPAIKITPLLIVKSWQGFWVAKILADSVNRYRTTLISSTTARRLDTTKGWVSLMVWLSITRSRLQQWSQGHFLHCGYLEHRFH